MSQAWSSLFKILGSTLEPFELLGFQKSLTIVGWPIRRPVEKNHLSRRSIVKCLFLVYNRYWTGVKFLGLGTRKTFMTQSSKSTLFFTELVTTKKNFLTSTGVEGMLKKKGVYAIEVIFSLLLLALTELANTQEITIYCFACQACRRAQQPFAQPIVAVLLKQSYTTYILKN